MRYQHKTPQRDQDHVVRPDPRRPRMCDTCMRPIIRVAANDGPEGLKALFSFGGSRMTRKDFERLAAALALTRPISDGSHLDTVTYAERASRLVQWRKDRDAIAQACRAANPNFDLDRFIVATER